jgi:GR25 family glycosyltransferase involved in LPS biosynthesis
MNQFQFYKNKDSHHNDISHHPHKSIEELAKICIDNSKAIGFNTQGFLKSSINNIDKLNTISSNSGGLYIHTERYEALLNKIKNKEYTSFIDYDFYPYKDSDGNNIETYIYTSISQIKEMADNNKDCVAFNTNGTLKSKICLESDFTNLDTDIIKGIYVKKTKFRIKLLCDWCDSKKLCNEWNKMSQNNYRWNDIEVTWKNTNIDFFVIINKPLNDTEYYDPTRTIIFQMEPWCGNDNQTWGVKTWGKWAKPEPDVFLQVRDHNKYVNNCFWQLNANYNDLNKMSFDKTRLLSTVCSSKYYDPGHIKRIDFLKFIEGKNDNIVKIDIYNTDNNHNFSGYKGAHPINGKDDAIMPYKYYFMPENNEERNFVTEKMWEPLLCECLCFYWGCPNISDIIDSRAYILLDLNNFEESFNIIKTAILNNEWAKRLEYIRMEKQKVLNYYNFFPTLERIIKNDFKFRTKPIDNDEVIYHKYFGDLLNIKINNICFIHSCTFNNNIDILSEIINHIFVKMGDNLDYIYVINIGDEIIMNTSNDKIKIINYSNKTDLFEKPTINLIKIFSKFNNSKILYLHTKGVSYNGQHQNITDWRRYMTHFLVNEYQVCLDLLDCYDTVGCNYNEKPFRHYSGNFWWARSDYIKKLESIKSVNSHDAEWWILGNSDVKNYTIFNSGVNHYEQLYGKELYDKNFADLYEIDDKMKIKCVNLVRRNDRKINISRELEKVGLLEDCEFIEAVDGMKLEGTDFIKKLFEGNDFGYRRSVIGCALSHYYLWEELAKDEVYDKYLILEDDGVLDKNLKFKLNYLKDKVSNIVFLGCHHFKANKGIYNEKIKNNGKVRVDILDLDICIGGTFGYIITREGAEKLLEYIGQNGIKHGIDYVMLKCMVDSGLREFEVLPHIIQSDLVECELNTDSDIQYNFDRLFD